jgi:sortase A
VTVQDTTPDPDVIVVDNDGEGADSGTAKPETAEEPPKRRQRRRLVLPTQRSRILLWTTVMLSLLALWLVLYAVAFSGFQERGSQGRLYDQLREELAGGPVPPPLGGAIEPGSPVALLEAPQIGLSQVVVEGTTSSDMTEGPGHRRDTALPGQPGVSVLFGRSVTFGAPFAKIAQLQLGQSITAVTGQGTFHFTVTGVRYAGDPLPPPPASGTGRLTLVTATGTGWRAQFAPSEVVYVDAQLQGSTQPAPAGRPTSVSAAEAPLAVDTADLTALVLWLQALVLVVAGTTWAALRWGGRQAWLVGAPLVLATVWGATQTVMVMTPNLL